MAIACEDTQKAPHPEGQEAFTIRARFPWQKQPGTRVVIETAADEDILKATPKRKIIQECGEPLWVEVRVYVLEETVAENFEERGWNRHRARDYIQPLTRVGRLTGIGWTSRTSSRS